MSTHTHRFALATLLVLAACGVGTGSGTTATTDQALTGIPCGQILDCYDLCDPNDGACIQQCYDAAYPTGQQLHDALNDCSVASGCADWSCVEQACGQQLEACELDVPPGGWICFSAGVYEVCDVYGYCHDRMAEGGGWGADQASAAFWSNADCEENMTISILIEQLDGSAGVKQGCAPTQCLPNE
ncbi:MAG: hypothetical protein H6738_05540 [Alphaproteobacteria bacterium]|nr:hypothetical protein [Alphaproteobacteria bacterium]MCB9696231.1 hypothetical protein [Alphaproteobacteria bacterium]